MQVKVGDKVSFLDDVGMGVVLELEDDQVLILRDDGFEEWVSQHQVIPYKPLNINSIVQKDTIARKQTPRIKPKERGVIEKDLHIHELLEVSKHLNNYEMLQLQLNTARQTIEKARRANAKKLVLIHGVGAGRLRSELHKLLKSMDNLSFYDADFLKYGVGATEIDLW